MPVEDDEGQTSQDHDDKFGIGNSHVSTITNEKYIQKQIQDSEYNNVDHVDPRMSRGDDESVAHQVRYVLKNEEKKEDV